MNTKRPRDDDVPDELEPDSQKSRSVSDEITITATETVENDLSRSLHQIEFGDDVYFDLTKYTHADFKILDRDALLLRHDMDLAPNKFDSLPIHENTNRYERVERFRGDPGIIAAGAFGFVIAGTYDGKPCIAKVLDVERIPLRTVLQEVLIQAILFDELNKDDECKHCTKVPELFAVLRSNGPVHNRQRTNGKWTYLEGSNKPVVMIVMQKISAALGTYLHKLKSARDRSCVCASVLYQVTNMFTHLQHKNLNFMHADLKTNNVTFDLVPGAQGCSRRNSRYETYLIDFGMSSLDYKGVRIGAGQIFRTLRYTQPNFHNPYTDVVYLVWSMWKFQGCKMDLLSSRTCNEYTILFSRVLRFILLSTGIPFRTVRDFDKISSETFRAMIVAGRLVVPEQHARNQIDYPYISDESVRDPTAIECAQVGHYMKLYMIASASPNRQRKEGAQKHLERITNLKDGDTSDGPGQGSD